MAATYQIFVKLLDGRTQCLNFPSPAISGAAIKIALRARTKAPLGSLRLVSGTRAISDATVLSVSGDGGLFPSCSLVGRLSGGKGGFGSLLRGAATKAGQKKTNNFDACRDLNGRRLRHVNAEKKLEEWQAEAEVRRLEKTAEEFLRKKAKEAKKINSGDTDKYVKKYRDDSSKCMEDVDEAVRRSFALYTEAKRKVLPLSDAPDSKRMKIWMGKKKLEESDSDEDDDSDDENEKSVVIDDRNPSTEDEGKGMEGSPSSDSVAQVDVGSSGKSSAQSDKDENEHSSECHLKINEGFDIVKPEVHGHKNLKEAMLTSSEDVVTSVGAKLVDEKHVESDSVPEAMVAEAGMIAAPAINDVLPSSVVQVEVVALTEAAVVVEEPLNFDDYNSAADLEVLGLERLKSELQAKGLKCGGTLHERAARLFLLKTTPRDKLPKKVLATK